MGILKGDGAGYLWEYFKSSRLVQGVCGVALGDSHCLLQDESTRDSTFSVIMFGDHCALQHQWTWVPPTVCRKDGKRVGSPCRPQCQSICERGDKEVGSTVHFSIIPPGHQCLQE